MSKANSFPFPLELVFSIRNANYAVPRPDTSTGFDFVRIIEVKPYKSGNRRRRLEGWTLLQTQHSDQWIGRFAFHPELGVAQLSAWNERWAAGVLAKIVASPLTAAAQYGAELGRCCSCGKSLTDDRSRWYGIGPECEKRWPEIVYESDEARGVYGQEVV